MRHGGDRPAAGGKDEKLSILESPAPLAACDSTQIINYQPFTKHDHHEENEMCKMRLDIRSGHRRPEERHSSWYSIREPSRRLALPGLQATEVHVLPDRIGRKVIRTNFKPRPYKAASHIIMTGCLVYI